ncbi:NADH dehydrogenase [Pedobacter sp. UYP30]|uniref:NAD(P)/FAD-dependent oxidoreductase n=1 Tax=Pedobacter sp. UYP30 TaxID=1756400 RepID=UPI0033951208
MEDKRIVIIGGGFAGINLARELGGKKGLEVTLVDRNNYNFFPPLLYQVATGVLSTSSICIPFRTLFDGKENLRFRLGEFEKVIPQQNKVILSTGEIYYDYLVISTGTENNYFGMENIKKNALPMKTVEDAIALRNYLINEAERYITVTDETEKRKMRNIVVSGAGPSGVEIAGMIADMSNRVLKTLYPEFDQSQMNLYLVDGASAVLPPMREESQKYSKESLEKIGVIVKLNKMVADYKDGVVYFKDGEQIETNTLIWTAGVIAPKFDGFPADCYEKGNRLKVDEFNKIDGLTNVYAIGDSCLQTNDLKFPKGYPQLGSVATQQGKALAKNFIAMVKNQSTKPFSYLDKGTMAIIGRNKAVADLTFPKTTLTGWLAWMAWLFVHLFLLINYRNQFRTMANWANAYFTKGRAQGIMVREPKYQQKN